MGSEIFSSNRPDPIAQAIMDAQLCEKGVEQLFDLLDPVLKRIASRIARQIPDDALQEAHIRIWRKVHKVRVETEQDRATAKSYIMQAAVTGMRDEVRRYLRSQKLKPMSIEVAGDTSQEEGSSAAANCDFGEVLTLYRDYIELTGDFAGAHKHVGSVLGISTAQASTRFHMAAKDFLKQLAASGGF